MSYRVTKQTEITDERIAAEALKIAGMTFTKQGNVLLITSGALSRASINLSNGEITGDSDFRGHSEEAFGLLRQSYAEALYRDVALKQGISIQNRQVENGDVVLYCRQG